MQALVEAVQRQLCDAVGDGLFATAVPGLSAVRARRPSFPETMVYRPVLCLVLQGAKTVRCGSAEAQLSAGRSLLVSLDMPVLSHVSAAPFLAVALELDAALLQEVALAVPPPAAPPSSGPGPAFAIGDIAVPAADAMLRLLRLAETPDAVPVLLPAILRELYYWLLTGPQGAALAHLALPDGHGARLARAVHRLRTGFAEPLSVPALAAEAALSPSAFYKHFKALTGMAPVQYRKALQLAEARRLMLAEGQTATAAAFATGYRSLSQFSRDFARAFGAPPRRSIAASRGREAA